MAKHRIELDDYELVNLREAMLFLKEVGGDTGDWFQQVRSKLAVPEVEMAPNRTRHEQQRELALRVGWSAMQWPQTVSFPEGS